MGDERRRGYFYDLPEYIKSLSTDSHTIYLHRHEIQQPPFPYISMVSWVINGLAGLETSIRIHQCNGLAVSQLGGAGERPSHLSNLIDKGKCWTEIFSTLASIGKQLWIRLKQRENRGDPQGDTKGNGRSWKSSIQVQKFDEDRKNDRVNFLFEHLLPGSKPIRSKQYAKNTQSIS